MPNHYLLAADLELLTSKGQQVHYPAGHVILAQNTPSDKLFLIEQGIVQIDFSRLYGDDVLAHLGPGELFGEISFMDRQATSANASAYQDCVLLEIPRDSLEIMLVSDKGLAARVYQTIAMTLATRVRAANRR